jgi:hypothetical protein
MLSFFCLQNSLHITGSAALMYSSMKDAMCEAFDITEGIDDFFSREKHVGLYLQAGADIE